MEVVKAAIKVVNGVEVPRSDERGYRTLVLKNGLKVILCSDPTTDMAGAALEVSVGHFSDPDNVAGIAHFLWVSRSAIRRALVPHVRVRSPTFLRSVRNEWPVVLRGPEGVLQVARRRWNAVG